jgi:hypothetical protein
MITTVTAHTGGIGNHRPAGIITLTAIRIDGERITVDPLHCPERLDSIANAGRGRIAVSTFQVMGGPEWCAPMCAATANLKPTLPVPIQVDSAGTDMEMLNA